ncbi:TerB family tellurite resistance protein [Aromatoleum evansii]|uniref:TerB family tellurite resistance protein n=1 Tax=Aromatoleum evansii TaxID=59406 RepID=A0ABZ1AIP8_AROEV|nr:TerB family tellurite resistance protein [Aromatoleum evansii]
MFEWERSTTMFANLRDLFNSLTAGPSSAAAAKGPDHALQLAAAVLLVEVMRSDEDYSPAERTAVVQALRNKFTLGDDELARLMDLADATSRDAPDLYSFTSRLNKGFSAEQKLRMVEYLWQVAYADGTLSHHENHLMRKLGDLLYIPRGDFIAAKQRGRAAAGAVEPDAPAE